jgi:hypothetical protein
MRIFSGLTIMFLHCVCFVKDNSLLEFKTIRYDIMIEDPMFELENVSNKIYITKTSIEMLISSSKLYFH